MDTNHERISELRSRFFDILWKEYKPIRAAMDIHGKNLLNPPHIRVDKEINGDIFSFPGWHELANQREDNEENAIVSSLLDKTLTEPSTVVSLGAFDGRRDINIIKDAKNMENILKTITVESNEYYHAQAVKNFSDTDLSVAPYSGKIEDFKEESGSFDESKQIILAYENIMLNLFPYALDSRYGIVANIPSFMNEGDEMILGINTSTGSKEYRDDAIEPMIENYSEALGLESLLGATLQANTNDWFRRIYLSGMDEN
ncbi:MAG: hypothetical protein ACOCZV_01250, partial [Nanoarchaeota archaeon]